MDFWGVLFCGGIIGFFVGGWFKQIDLKKRKNPNGNSDTQRHENALRKIAERERRVDYILSHYAQDRVLSLLEATSADEDLTYRAIALAHALDAGFPERNFTWTIPAHELLFSWANKNRWGAPSLLSVSQLQEITHRAIDLTEACNYVTTEDCETLLSFMNLGISETLEQATNRLRGEGHKQVAELLKKELRGSQFNYASDVFPYTENEPI